MKRVLLLLLIFSLLAQAGGVLALSSPSYRLDWFTLLTTGGGGTAHSTHYIANITIGQSAYQPAASTHYRAGMGYWYGSPPLHPLYLPMVLRNK